jgi:hypothetical protein
MHRSLLKAGPTAEIFKERQLAPPPCFKAITKEVSGGLASLALLTDESRYKCIKDFYSTKHHEALNKANLTPTYVPMLQAILAFNVGREKRKEEKLERDKQRNKLVYFCIDYSKLWKVPMQGIESCDFKVRDCNCRGSRGTGKCQYGRFCMMPIVICRVTYKMTNKIYIGSTQQHFKMRMRDHFQDVKKLMEKGVLADSYARKCTGIWPRGAAAPLPGMQQDMIQCDILWKGNLISIVDFLWKSYLHSV